MESTQNYHSLKNPKRVYYMSLEFLLGRTLDNAMLNMMVKKEFDAALTGLGFRVEDLIEEEMDAALGNGGLGRLAACFMDSLATLDYPAWGYGIRYQYGIFQQRIMDGYQTEFPDYWLNFGNPWEIERLDVCYEIRSADIPIPGYDTKNCINIRLWSSKPTKEFDFASFNDGNYDKSVEEQKAAENITAVLYPNDNHMVGKILRLKQQYFFVSATLQDVIRRFKKSNLPWNQFPNQVSIQLNDTHPTLGIAELQRILVDEEGLLWDDAWDIVTKTYSFTNHTVLPEALERWAVPLMQDLLPRLMMIIFDINLFFLQKVERVYPGDRDRLRRMSIVEEGQPQYIRMAFLAVVGSHTVNGLPLCTLSLWLHQANPRLSNLIAEKLGSESFLKNLSDLQQLKKFANDATFQKQWMDIKYRNKVRLAQHIQVHCGVEVSPDALFDIQCKRFHEYKRPCKQTKKVVIFAGKSAPGYYIAKLIIKLINNVSAIINEDPKTAEYLKLVFIPNYNVSLAEIIIPASDISQHISTAGTEASGTSNMKFVLNGGLIIGTVDGANIEIGEEVGAENIWLFGALTPDVEDIRHAQRYRPTILDPSLDLVVKAIQCGEFGEPSIFEPLINTLTVGHDFYIVSKDFNAYLETLAAIDEAYKDKSAWAKKSINAAASMGKFSSDRSIQDYAQNIWGLKPVPQPSA
ncbi:glycosyl transferase [Rhizoclosmatium globosum]|uniref:Alpha-1,4 glucan phosphorylase n=1 Tax=Rhizoclosmatium globosum TaxID=329046 RepID=A0A1Y2CNI2_9FUNG|nr:glycosyl transferase [Rhizoclosmatium globosum]|eukprot:ORY48562.1 glycosyl transferase [Rhizoclosmatium globosum]